MRFANVDELIGRWEGLEASLRTPGKDEAALGEELRSLLQQCREAGRQITQVGERYQLQWLARQIGDVLFRLTREYPGTALAPPSPSLTIFHVPHPRNPFFTDREEVLAELWQRFTEGPRVTPVEVLCGLGGVGKTQTAVEYAYRYRPRYRAVFWIPAETRANLRGGFLNLAQLLDLPEKDAPEEATTTLAVTHWLERNAGWLLIFDDANHPEWLPAFCPLTAPGHILVTSRAQVFDMLGVTRPVELSVLLPPDGVEFFRKRTGGHGWEDRDREAAAELARELGYLPLALEQAGAFLVAHQRGIPEYLDDYRRRRLELLKESKPVTGMSPAPVAATWQMNFQAVEKQSAPAADLLRLSAFWWADNIPLELLVQGASEMGPALAKALEHPEDPVALFKVLDPLARYSLVRREARAQTYSIHPLVQEVLRERMDEAARRLWAERAVKALSRAFPEAGPTKNWPLCERLLAHARAGAGLVKEYGLDFPEAARLVYEAAYYLRERGQYAEAEDLHLQALALRRKWAAQEGAPGPRHQDLAGSLNNLAGLYRIQGLYAKALPLYQEALALRERALGPDHPEVAASLNNLALLYSDLGRNPEAEERFRQALALYEKALKPDHPKVAACLQNLGWLLFAQWKLDEAEQLFQRARLIWEKELGPNHPDVAVSLENLAAVYLFQKRFPQAEEFTRQVLAIRENVLGPAHPEVAASLHNLAVVCAARGNPVEAEALYRQALESFERSLGPDHPNLALALKNYSDLLRSLGRDREAERLEKRAREIQKDRHQPKELAMRDQIFVSYSHRDKEWLEKLQVMLKPLVRQKVITLWDDTQLTPGGKWRDEIAAALGRARVAVLLVSPNFLASDFIAEHELPPLLKAAEEEGLVILQVHVSASLYGETELGEYQAAHDPARPLDALPPADQNKLLVAICQKIKAAAT